MDIITREQNSVDVDYPQDYDPSLNGVGGFLVLIIIGRILSIIMGIKDISDTSKYLGYDPRLDLFAWPGIILELLTIVLSGLILYYIFTRRIVFRFLLVVSIALVILFDIFSIIYLSNLGVKPDMYYFVLHILTGAIWIPYFYLSKRIKNTYIYPKQYPHLY